jgi:PAS domain S-box-containing protein
VETYQKELARIREILKENSRGMTVTDISKELNMNRNSVAKYLDILLISGHAEMVTFGPAKVFFPSRRIPISAMLNFTLDYVILFDKELKIIQVNDNLLELLHIQSDGIIGQRIEDSSISIFKIPEMVEYANKALDGNESLLEANFKVEGKELYFKAKHIPTTFDDGEPGVTLIIEDITDQKVAEEKLKLAINEWETTFNSITDMVSIHDKDFNIVKTNNAFAKYFQSRPDEIVGKKCYEIIHGTKNMYSSCPCKKIKISKKPATVQFFEPHLGKYLEISASPIFDDNGEISGAVHIMKDVTDRKNKENRS